jgi:hypothetical protein
VLGISPTSAGYKTWTFTPALDGLDLEHAEGTVVTAYGDIEAKWKIEGKQIHVKTNVPGGTTATLAVPRGYCTRYRSKSYQGGNVPLKSGGKVSLTLKQC